MLSIKEQMFVLRYLNTEGEEENLGQLYVDIFGYDEENKNDIRTYTAKAKRLIKTKRCKEEIIRLQANDTVSTDNPDEVKAFIVKELLRIYTQSSTLIPVYDRNGKLLEGKSEYMDSSVVKSSLDMLGKSIGLFKEVVESKEEVINITANGVSVESQFIGKGDIVDGKLS